MYRELFEGIALNDFCEARVLCGGDDILFVAGWNEPVVVFDKSGSMIKRHMLCEGEKGYIWTDGGGASHEIEVDMFDKGGVIERYTLPETGKGFIRTDGGGVSHKIGAEMRADGRDMVINDARGGEIRFEKGAQGANWRIKRAILPGRSYEYHYVGEYLIAVSCGGDRTIFAYDGAGRVNLIASGAGVVSVTYADDRIVALTGGRGSSIIFRYNSGRITGASWENGEMSICENRVEVCDFSDKNDPKMEKINYTFHTLPDRIPTDISTLFDIWGI